MVEVNRMTLLERIACNNFAMINGYAYFSCHYYNGFFATEIKTGNTFFLGTFADEKISQRRLHREVFLRGDKIFICPRMGRHVHIWNLKDETMKSVEIRSKDEEPFETTRVILGEKSLFLMPGSKEILTRRIDLESLKVIEVNKKSEIQGKDLYAFKEIFPNPQLIRRWLKEYADIFFWRQVSDKWYAFHPLGCHLLRYEEKIGKIEMIPLIIVNKRELEEHLYRVRIELLERSPESEIVIRLKNFIDEIERKEICDENEVKRNKYTGRRIWKYVKQNVCQQEV